MFQITYCVRVNDVFKHGVEGTYKTELVAKRHIRRLRRKYPGTEFKIRGGHGNENKIT